PRRPVRLREHLHDLMSCPQDRAQRRQPEFAAPAEDDAHRAHRVTLSLSPSHPITPHPLTLFTPSFFTPLLEILLQFAQPPLPLHLRNRAHSVGDQRAIEVIGLVLPDARDEAALGVGGGFTFQILSIEAQL